MTPARASFLLLAVNIPAASMYTYLPSMRIVFLVSMFISETSKAEIPLLSAPSIENNQALEASSNFLFTASALGRFSRLTCQQLSRVPQRESVNPSLGRSGSFPFRK